VDSSNGVTDPLSPQNTNANYPAHLAPDQKRFNAALNLPKFPPQPTSLRNR
jgi:hypothetical protein